MWNDDLGAVFADFPHVLQQIKDILKPNKHKDKPIKMDTEEQKSSIVISEDSTAEELAPIAKALYELLLLHIAMRSRNKNGVRVEKGEVVDFEYTGPVLERVLKENRVIRTTLLKGIYAGVPVAVAPIRIRKGEVIAALGVFDVLRNIELGAGLIDFPHVLEHIKSYLKSKPARE